MRPPLQADRRLHPRTGDPIFFLISRRLACFVGAPMLSRVPALLAKAEKPDPAKQAGVSDPGYN
jgi:hypothetical protein